MGNVGGQSGGAGTFNYSEYMAGASGFDYTKYMGGQGGAGGFDYSQYTGGQSGGASGGASGSFNHSKYMEGQNGTGGSQGSFDYSQYMTGRNDHGSQGGFDYSKYVGGQSGRAGTFNYSEYMEHPSDPGSWQDKSKQRSDGFKKSVGSAFLPGSSPKTGQGTGNFDYSKYMSGGAGGFYPSKYMSADQNADDSSQSGFDNSKYTGRAGGSQRAAGFDGQNGTGSEYVGGQSGDGSTVQESSQPAVSGKSIEVLATEPGETRTARPLLHAVLGLALLVSVVLVAYARKPQQASDFDADSRHSLLELRGCSGSVGEACGC